MAESKRAREAREALEATVERRQSALSGRTPDNDPEKMKELRSFSELQEELFGPHRDIDPNTPAVTEVKEKEMTWENLANGHLMREDVSKSQNSRLNREFKNWQNEGNRKIIGSLNKLGVSLLDIDWKAVRDSYGSTQ